MSQKEVNLIQKPHYKQDYLKYFSDIKAHIDKQRDDLKSKIDSYYDELIVNITKIEAECHKRANNIEKLSKNLRETKKSLDLILGQSATCSLKNKKFETVIIKTNRLKSKLDEKIIEFKKILLSSSELIFEPIQIEARILFESSNINENISELNGSKGSISCKELVIQV